MLPHLTHLPPAFLLPPALGLVASLTGTALAYRARRVGSQPNCRRCGYDLRGKPAESRACPECGADLASPRAIRIGQRVTRRGLLATSMAMLFLSAASLIGLGVGVAKGVDWNRHKPQWWLVREARGIDASGRDAALGELARRVADKQTSDAQMAALTDEALAYQADLNKPWVRGWGDVLEAGRKAGRLSDEKWRRYARQAIVPSVTLWARPVVRRNDPLFTQIRVNPTRIAGAVFYVRWDSVQADEVSGFPIGRSIYQNNSNRLGQFAAIRSCGESPRLTSSTWKHLVDGPQTVRVPLNVVAYDTPGAVGTPLVNENIVLTANWTLVPKDAPPVRLRTDPALAAAVRASVQVKSLTASENGTLLVMVLSFDNPPLPLMMSFSIRSNGKEWQSEGGVFVDAGKRRTFFNLRFRSVLLPGPQTVDVVLKPDIEGAAKCWDVGEIWGSEIVFRDVTVIRVEFAMSAPQADLPMVFLLVPAVGLTVGLAVAAFTRRGRRFARRRSLAAAFVLEALSVTCMGFQVFWDNDSTGDIDGHPLPYRHFEGFVRFSGGVEPERGESLALPMTPDMWAHLADGPQTLKLPLDLKIFYSGQLSGTPVLEEKLMLSRCWNLVPASPLQQTRRRPGSDGGIVHGGH